MDNLRQEVGTLRYQIDIVFDNFKEIVLPYRLELDKKTYSIYVYYLEYIIVKLVSNLEFIFKEITLAYVQKTSNERIKSYIKTKTFDRGLNPNKENLGGVFKGIFGVDFDILSQEELNLLDKFVKLRNGLAHGATPENLSDIDLAALKRFYEISIKIQDHLLELYER
jgi:hypothetical protein